MKKIFVYFTILLLSHNAFSITKIALSKNMSDISYASLFENENYKFLYCNDSQEAAKALMDGYCDASIFSLPAAAQIHELSDKRIVCVAVTQDTSFYCVSSDKNCRVISDLLGKRISSASGGLQEAMVTSVFEKCDIPIERGRGGVTIEWDENYSIPLSQLIQGKSSFAILTEPAVTTALKHNRLHIVVDFKNELEAIEGRKIVFPGAVLMVRKDYLSEKADEAQKFFFDMEGSSRLLNENPSKAAFVINRNTKLFKTALLSNVIKKSGYVYLNDKKTQEDLFYVCSIYNSVYRKKLKDEIKEIKISHEFFNNELVP